MSEILTPIQFSVDDYLELTRSERFSDRSLELLKGQIVEIVPPGPLHIHTRRRLREAFRKLLAQGAVTDLSGDPIQGSDSMPQPDYALARADALREDRFPSPADLFLAIEVSDSSILKDRLIKVPLYAELGIREYWIVNLQDRQIEVHHHPNPRTRMYEQMLVGKPGESIAPTAFPAYPVQVGDIFPPL